MNLVQGSVWCTCVGLLLGFTLAMGQTASGGPTPSREAVPLAPLKEDTTQQKILPLPESGATEHFRYERDRDNMYWIMPADGSSSYLVSAGFLQRTLGLLQLDSFQQEEILRKYPAMMQQMFTQILSQAYPDGTVVYEEPFLSQSFEGTDGTQTFLEQDPAAGPYVRVRLISRGSEPEEFSVARAMVERLLANGRLTDDQLLQGLRSFPFRLPESARAVDFTHLSAEQLAALVQAEPALSRYEFIQLGRYSDGTEDSSSDTPHQPRAPRVEPPPTPASLSSVPLGVQSKPASSPLPSQTAATRRTSEEPQPNTGANASGRDESSHQGAESLERSSIAQTEAASARDIWTSIQKQGLQIVVISVFSLGIIALVVSRFFYSKPTS